MNLQEKMNLRKKMVGDLRAYLDKCGDRLTKPQEEEYYRMKADYDALRDAIHREIEQQERDKEERALDAPASTAHPAAGQKAEPLRSGEVRMLRPGDSMRSCFANELPGGIHESDLSLAAYARGIVLGQWDQVPGELRTMSSSGTGAYVLPSPLSTKVIDAARAEATVFRAGAITIPMTTRTLRIPRLDQDGVGYWRAENEAITASDLVLSPIDLTAHTCGILIKLSRELFDDSPVLDTVLSQSVSAAMAQIIDSAALSGSGEDEVPCGIMETDNILTDAANGGAISYGNFATAYSRLLAQNAPQDGIATIYNPRTFGQIDALRNGTQDYLAPNQSFLRMKHFVTSQIPDTLGGGTDSAIVSGHFPALAIGMRKDLELRLFESGGDGPETLDAVAKYQVILRGIIRMDVAVLRPGFFHVTTGVAADAE